MRTHKYCPACNTVKHLHEFSKSSGSKDGLQGRCKTCFAIYQRARKYGISEAQYRALYESQGGECAICGDSERVLVVDHNHETNKVRGLLCNQCNTGIGLLGDSLEIIRRAEGYLIHD